MSVFEQAKAIVPPTQDRSLWMIIACVVLSHALLLLSSFLIQSEPKKTILSTPQRLIVQTINLDHKKANPIKKNKIKNNESIPIQKESKLSQDTLDTSSIVAESEIKPEFITPPEPVPLVKEIPLEPVVPTVSKESVPPEEPIKQIESPSKLNPPKPAEIKSPEPVVNDTKPIPKKIEVKKTEPKKIEKPTPPPKPVQKNNPAPAKIEAPKKSTTLPKPVVKKQPTAATAEANSLEKAKKAEAERLAVERQKKIDAEQQAIRARQQKLLSQAQETIAKIDRSRDKVNRENFSNSGNMTSPIAISSLQIDSLPENGSKQQLSFQEASYRDELASRLKLALTLPEYGEVKIKLVLERSGKVAKVSIVSAASEANKKYIEKKLQTMSFPPFGANFDKSSQFTFSITLSNDM